MRTGVAVLPPLVLGATRFLISGPLMLLLCTLRGLPLFPSRRDLKYLVAIGILMLGMGNLAVILAEQYLPSGFAALLVAVIPLYVALLEAFLPNGERLNSRGWLGIGLGFAGLAILVSPSLRQAFAAHSFRGSTQLLGCCISLTGAFAWSTASILSRRAAIQSSVFVAAAWEMVFAGLFDFLLLTITGGSLRHVAWSRQAVLSIAWLVVFGSLVTYSAYIYLLDRVPVAKVSTYAYVNPIIAVLLGALLLGERLLPIEYAGMLFILLAVYLVTSSKLQPVPSPALEIETEPELIT